MIFCMDDTIRTTWRIKLSVSQSVIQSVRKPGRQSVSQPVHQWQICSIKSSVVQCWEFWRYDRHADHIAPTSTQAYAHKLGQWPWHWLPSRWHYQWSLTTSAWLWFLLLTFSFSFFNSSILVSFLLCFLSFLFPLSTYLSVFLSLFLLSHGTQTWALETLASTSLSIPTKVRIIFSKWLLVCVVVSIRTFSSLTSPSG